MRCDESVQDHSLSQNNNQMPNSYTQEGKNPGMAKRWSENLWVIPEFTDSGVLPSLIYKTAQNNNSENIYLAHGMRQQSVTDSDCI
eukprot:2536694-Amphidinium_carterae.1